MFGKKKEPSIPMPTKQEYKIEDAIPVASPELKEPAKIQELPSFQVDIDKVIKRIEEQDKLIIQLQNGYQVMNEYKDKLKKLEQQENKGKLKEDEIQGFENNINALIEEIREILMIKVGDLPLEEGVVQIEAWIKEQPVPNYYYASTNSYYYLLEVIRTKEKLRQKEEALILMLNNWKTALRA